MREMISLFAICTPICPETVWKDWYQFCMRQEQKYDFSFSHVSFESESLKPNGVRTRSRYLSKVEACIHGKESISHLGFYVLPADFRQAVFDFKVYMGVSFGKYNCCEAVIENHFLEGFQYEVYLDEVKKFLHMSRAEVNLLPHTQVFNYNMKRIISPVDTQETYGVIQKIYAE